MTCIQCGAPVPIDSPWSDACGARCSHARLHAIMAWARSVGGFKRAAELLKAGQTPQLKEGDP